MNKKDTYITPDEKYWGGKWKPILESPNYSINEYGVFKSLERKVLSKDGRFRKVRERIMPWTISCKGYARVAISMGEKSKRIVIRKSVHRLVASVFCSDYDKFPQINHEDGNKLNNHYTNLKPCNGTYNQKHAYNTGLKVNKKSWEDSQSKAVIQYSDNGEEMNRFGSMGEAARITKVERTSIRNSCNGKTGRRWGRPFQFKFTENV